MSHTSTYAIKVKDVNLFCNVALNKGHKVNFLNRLNEQSEQTVKFFGSNTVQAVASISLDGWRYPIAINKEGQISYDHFGSQPHTMKKLGEVLQEYSTKLIFQNVPMDIVKNSFSENIKETGAVKITLVC